MITILCKTCKERLTDFRFFDIIPRRTPRVRRLSKRKNPKKEQNIESILRHLEPLRGRHQEQPRHASDRRYTEHVHKTERGQFPQTQKHAREHRHPLQVRAALAQRAHRHPLHEHDHPEFGRRQMRGFASLSPCGKRPAEHPLVVRAGPSQRALLDGAKRHGLERRGTLAMYLPVRLRHPPRRCRKRHRPPSARHRRAERLHRAGQNRTGLLRVLERLHAGPDEAHAAPLPSRNRQQRSVVPYTLKMPYRSSNNEVVFHDVYAKTAWNVRRSCGSTRGILISLFTEIHFRNSPHVRISNREVGGSEMHLDHAFTKCLCSSILEIASRIVQYRNISSRSISRSE